MNRIAHGWNFGDLDDRILEKEYRYVRVESFKFQGHRSEDDMLVKSKKENDHISHLKQAFEVMRIYGMKLNLTECTFGHVMARPDASRRLVKLAVELGEHDIEHQDRASIKAQILANCIMEFVEEIEIEVTARLSFATTNNEAEYEALILGLELAHEAGAKELDVCTDP
ncbi:UNVERIFIED_CONTAM: hypothetical protein Scaly_2784000 [Sesamum calycinum]|uniref:RNase H type-1 domain-containing protein n=1 Tax=Sesamum calycinum TaxID=2727403 RepID=A0AAW2IX59_9LAMI